MNNIEKRITSTIKESLKAGFDYDAQDSEIQIEIPKDKGHGDYSTNVAMRLTKTLKDNPRNIAEKLVSELSKHEDVFTDISIAGPGFINFRVNQQLLAEVLELVLREQDNYGKSTFGNVINVNVEYVSANPTGDLHPGHARGAAMGDSLTRILTAAGYNVTREFYLNDAGAQIDNMAKSVQARYLQEFGVDIELPEDGYFGPDIITIAQQLKADVDDKYVSDDLTEYLSEFREYGLEKEMEKLERDLDLYRVHFDVWTRESSLYEKDKVSEVLEKLKDSGYTYEEEGALWLKTTDFGDDKDRVLIKSNGLYTYLLPDIAYHQDKFDRGFDLLVNLFGADHHGYINRLKASMEILGYNRDQLEVDIIQMVMMIKDGKEFKLSKRSGESISLRELIDVIGIDAMRYFYVMHAADSQMDLDIDLAISESSENPVYYAQYAHARMCSILTQGQKYEKTHSFDLLVDDKEVELMKHINEFPNVVVQSAKVREPHRICNYIQKLASNFHSFYGNNQVLNDQNPELTSQRLGLVEATKITLANALDLIGVSAPESM